MVNPMSKHQRDSWLQELGYSFKQLEADTQILRKWLNEQPHLPPSKMKETDWFLMSFLLGCKGSLEKSKRKLDNYYSFRSSGCPFYGKYDPTSKEMEGQGEITRVGFLPNTMDDGTRIYVYRPTSLLTSKRILTGLKATVMSIELELRREEIRPMTIILLYDLKDASASEFLKTNPLHSRDFFYLLQEVFPFRIKHMLCINIHPTLAAASNYLLKPFLSKKINERVQISATGLDVITKIVPKSAIPKEMGGDGDVSIQIVSDDFFETTRKKRDWFVHELGQTTDESKRPANCDRSEHPYCGPEGTFKMLIID